MNNDSINRNGTVRLKRNKKKIKIRRFICQTKKKCVWPKENSQVQLRAQELKSGY